MSRKTGKHPSVPPAEEEELTGEQQRMRETARRLKGDAKPELEGAPPAPAGPRPPSRIAVHDLGVIAAALVVLAGAGLAHRALTAPRFTTHRQGVLAVQVPVGWLERPRSTRAGAGDVNGHAFQAFDDPRVWLEVEERPRPPFPGPLGPVLDLEWNRRAGILVKRVERQSELRQGRAWLRTRYAIAHTPTPGDAPALAGAVELAIVNADRVFVVTLHGPEERLAEFEPSVLGTLALGDGGR